MTVCVKYIKKNTELWGTKGVRDRFWGLEGIRGT